VETLRQTAIDAGDVKNLSEKLRSLAATARIANVPSVVSNVWLGIAIAASTSGWTADGDLPGVTPALILAGVSLYLAGNFLNDWADRAWDASHRPERALPRGLLSPTFYLAVAIASGALGLCLAAAVHLHSLVVALAIGIFILLYTWIHKRVTWSVVPMGLCRALLPVLGYVGFVTSLDSAPALRESAITALCACAFGLFCHIVGLSLSARTEAMDRPPSGILRLARLLFPVAAASVFFAAWQGLSLTPAASLGGLLPYGLWIALCLTLFRQPVPVHVSNLLAGIPLVDWIILLPIALTLADSGSGWSPFVTTCFAIPPIAFLAGKALQKLAPAT
jgi:4-hydroxybenzoate polyprenyltransferase